MDCAMGWRRRASAGAGHRCGCRSTELDEVNEAREVKDVIVVRLW